MDIRKELRDILRYKFKKYLVKEWVNGRKRLIDPAEQRKEYEIIENYCKTNYFKLKLYLIRKREKLRRYLKADMTYKNF